MQPLRVPTLKVAAPKSEAPNRHVKIAGLQRRLRRSEQSLIQVVADVARQSDAMVAQIKRNDLLRNRAFVEHEQKLRGGLDRLARRVRGDVRKHDEVTLDRQSVYTMATGRIAALPHRAEVERLRSAFKTLDIHYEPCGKVKRCKLSDNHIGECKEES